MLLGPFVRADQIGGSPRGRMGTLCAAIGLYALKRAGQCRGCARCQVRKMILTRKAEWERRRRVMEVIASEPLPGCSRARNQGLRHINMIEYRRSRDEDEKEWGLRTDFVEHGKRDACPPLCTCAPPPLPSCYGTQLGHTHRARIGWRRPRRNLCAACICIVSAAVPLSCWHWQLQTIE